MTTTNDEAPKILDVPIGLDASGMRREFDSLGDVQVRADRYWGAQTQRSLQHFNIGHDRMPKEVYHAYGYVKKAAAAVNTAAGRLPAWKGELIGRVNQDVTSAAVLLFDVDHFKQVNDTYGHDAGDDVLRELAARTIKSVRSVDLAVRWGGEEFLVVMPETDLANAAAVAERLRAAVAKDPFTIKSSGEKLAVTISVGVAAAIAGGDHRDRLLKRADDALYSAKSAGRNRVILCSENM